MSQRQLHDRALMMADDCLGVVVNLLQEEEQILAREAFYHICKSGIEVFNIERDRVRQRLNPTKN